MKSFEQQFADWVAKMPPEQPYDYASNYHCALCQFLGASGIARDPVVGGVWWHDGLGGETHRLSEHVRAGLRTRPWTFGALSERLAVAAAEREAA